MLPIRHSKNYSLLYFDAEKGINRELRYAPNQKSVFVDEQDSHPVLEPIIFTDGMLNVPANKQLLQQFLEIHPLNGKKFVEVNKEKDAEAELANIANEVDAMYKAKELDIEQLEMVYRIMFGKDPSVIKTAELRRDVLVKAKSAPKDFLAVFNNPDIKLRSTISKFFEDKLLTSRNNNSEIFFNLVDNKKRMLAIPYGSDPMDEMIRFFKSNEGVEILSMLEKT